MATVAYARGLRKVYTGGVIALDGVDLEVREGEVVALVGPNGAGKTTTFRIMVGLLKPTSGRVVIDGVDVTRSPLEARKRVTYVPEEVGGYRQLTGLEHLRLMITLFMAARGASKREVEEALEEAIRISGLTERDLRRRVSGYSKGMKRRLQVAWALAVHPRLAILDEPTSGLDVVASYKLRLTLREYARRHGVSILFSSHNMLEVEAIADRVYLIHRGRVIASGAPREIVEEAGTSNLEEAFVKLAGEA